MKIQKELSGNPNGYDVELSFLKKWNELEIEEQLKTLDEFESHELHFFLYKKDRKFFDVVVKPHLTSKLEKTFVDYY